MSKWGIFINQLPWLGEHHGREGRKNVKSRGWEEGPEMPSSGHGVDMVYYSTHELTTAVITIQGQDC